MAKITFDLFSALVIGTLSAFVYSMISINVTNLLRKIRKENNFGLQLFFSFIAVIIFLLLLFLFILITNSILK